MAAAGKKAPDVVKRLTDPSKYTGTHKERFDDEVGPRRVTCALRARDPRTGRELRRFFFFPSFLALSPQARAVVDASVLFSRLTPARPPRRARARARKAAPPAMCMT
jgi:hypothetical protein